MTELPSELRQALQVDESGDLDAIIRQHRPADFEALRRLLRAGPEAGPLLRVRAIYALGRWGDPAVVGEILTLLPALDQDERIKAIDALGRLGTDEAAAGVLAYARDDSLPVRKFVTRALGRIGTPRARAGLGELSQSDSSEYIRSLAAAQLTGT
jgi:HEAT repeat protein